MTVATILEKMTDTPDPVNGSVFEKQIDTDIVSFDRFMRAAFKKIEGHMVNENGCLLAMYHGDRNDMYSHVGTFNFEKSMGYFGGSRLGTENPWRKEGEPLVRNPFKGVTA
jgi:hypothetical protein